MLEIRNLTKVYKPKKGVAVTALNNVSLNIEEKGLVFILGKSGSGKSTLLNLLGGLDKYDAGDIIIKGKSTKDFAQSNFDSYRNTYVGFIFQEYNILDDFSVGANIALAIELQGRKASNIEVNAILKILDLDGYGARRPNELSGGQKQRVAIARALVKNPDIILADEPTGALDSKTGIQIFDILKKLSKDKLVLVVSHDREFAEEYGDRVIELADGKIISDITKKHVSSSQDEEANLQYVKNEGLIVKEGYKLSPQDLDMINAYLEKEKQINIVTKPSDTFAKEEVFVETSTKLDLKDYKEELKMIKSKLPNKMAFRMGASGLNHKKIRLVFTILLSLVAFTLFGVTDALAAYNKTTATVNSIIAEDIKAAVFSKRIENEIIDGDYKYYDYRDLLLSDEDLLFLNENLSFGSEYKFKPVYSGGQLDSYSSGSYSIARNFSFNNREYYRDNYHLSYLAGFVEYSKDELIDLGFQIHGDMPTTDNEIAITKYTFDHFAKYGYKNDTKKINKEADEINDYDDIIGEIILAEGNYGSLLTFTITAVIDTMIEEDRYESLKSPDSYEYDYFLETEFNRTIKYGHHSLGYVNSGFIQRSIDKNKFTGVELRDIAYYAIHKVDNEGNGFMFNVERIDKLDNFDNENVTFINKNKTSLSENEIITSLETYLSLAPAKEILIEDFQLPMSGFQTIYNQTIHEYVYEYAKENYQIAEENGLYTDLNIIEEDEARKIQVLWEHLIREKDEDFAKAGYFHSKYVEKSGDDLIREGLKLKSNEILSYTEEYTDNFFNIINRIKHNAFFIYAFENYEVAEANNFYEVRASLYGDEREFNIFEKVNILSDYLQYDEEGYNNNIYVPKTGKEIEASNEMLEYYIDYFIKDISEEIKVDQEYHRYYLHEYDKGLTKIKIVGFYIDSERPSYCETIITNDNLYDELEKFGAINPYCFALAKMPNSRNDIKKIVELGYQDNDNTYFPLQNSITPTIEMANDIVEQVSNVFFYIGLSFAVFAGLMLSNFIGTSVTRKKREIGILRALGARSNDVFKIFFNESFIIALINFILSTIATMIVVTILNTTLREQGGIKISLFTFSIRQVALVFAISIFVALVASYLPVRRIAKKKPVDAISNK